MWDGKRGRIRCAWKTRTHGQVVLKGIPLAELCGTTWKGDWHRNLCATGIGTNSHHCHWLPAVTCNKNFYQFCVSLLPTKSLGQGRGDNFDSYIICLWFHFLRRQAIYFYMRWIHFGTISVGIPFILLVVFAMHFPQILDQAYYWLSSDFYWLSSDFYWIVRHSSPRRSSPQTFITPYLFSDIHHPLPKFRHSSPQTFITSDIHHPLM